MATVAGSMIKESIRHIEEWANPRTVVVVTLLLVGTLWLALMVSVVSDRDESIATTGGILQRMTHAVEEQTRQQFRVADTFLASCEHWLQANPGLDPRTDKTFRQLIEAFRAGTGQSIDIYLLASDGRMFDILDPAQGPLANVADRDYFKNALNRPGLFVGSPMRKPLADHDGLPISLSLRRPVDDIQVLLAVIDLPTLTRSYEKQRLQPGGAITLLRRDGTVLARAPHDDRLPGHSMAGEALFSKHLGQQPQALVLPEASPGTQAREFISYSSMPDFPLVIMVSEDYDEALAAWLRQTAWVILLGLGVTLPLAVITYRSLRLLQALASQDAELQRLTTTDLLTGCSSRQHFFETLAEEVARARRRQAPLDRRVVRYRLFPADQRRLWPRHWRPGPDPVCQYRERGSSRQGPSWQTRRRGIRACAAQYRSPGSCPGRRTGSHSDPRHIDPERQRHRSVHGQCRGERSPGWRHVD
jgi:hypothetical protein